MLTAAKQREKLKRQNRKRLTPALIRKVNPLASALDADNVCRHPRDIADLAHRIEHHGEHAVTNAQRDLVAKNLPPGSMTNRYGESLARQTRSDLVEFGKAGS